MRVTFRQSVWLTLAMSLGLALSLPLAAAGLDAEALDRNLGRLKGEVIELNRDLMLLEEDLLFPASNRVSVFVATDVGDLFTLDSVQIRFDDKIVANHIYSPHERTALARGGMHRIYLGNLKPGEHEVVAFVTGADIHGRSWRRGASLRLDKDTEPKYLELRITDLERQLGPNFAIKEWEAP